jgi:hypothetical protein
MATVAFSGDSKELDVETAAIELLKAGFRLRLLPERYVPILGHPLDNFIEATIEVPEAEAEVEIWERKAWKQVNMIVRQYGGDCCQFGPVDEASYRPFWDVFRNEEDYRYGLEPA